MVSISELAVSLTLFSSRILQEFSVIILQAAILMIFCQVALVFIWVKIMNKQLALRKGEASDELIEGLQVTGIGNSNKSPFSATISHEDSILKSQQNGSKSLLTQSDSTEEVAEFKESFWIWRDFRKYMAVIGLITVGLGVLSVVFRDNEDYIIMLGTLSGVTEAQLAVPQFILNAKRRNTEGLSLILILMWLLGDLFKCLYYYLRVAPV